MRKQVGHVAAVLHDSAALVLALAVLARMVQAAGPVSSRQRRPSTYQTLLHPDHDGLSSDDPQGSPDTRPRLEP